MGLEQLNTAIEPGLSRPPETPDEIKFADEKLADDKALAVVLTDADIAERFLQSKAFPQQWNTADQLYATVPETRFWPGTQMARSKLPMPLIMEVVEQLLPQAHLAFFSDPTPFTVEPKGKTSPQAARAAAHVALWAVKESGFKEEIRKILKSALLYGTGVGKWGWETGKKTRKVYSRDAQGALQSQQVEKEYSCPTFGYVPLRQLLFDPHAVSNISFGRYVIHQDMISFDDLDAMRTSGMYKNVPTREQLKLIMSSKNEPTVDSLEGSKVQNWRTHQAQLDTLAGSSDPTKQKLEILEYWTADRVVTVLQRKIVLRNEANEFGRLPFVSSSFIDVPGSFLGFGVARLLEGEQLFEEGVINSYIDALALTLTPAFQRKGGVGPSNQNIVLAPGKIVNDAGELVPLHKESVSLEAQAAVQASENRARRRVGANFGSDMPNQALRTAEGVQEFTASLQTRLQFFVENFADSVFIPVLESFIDLSKEMLSPKQIDEILTDAEGKAFQGEILDVYNGQYSFSVLSSTKLAARRAMAGMVPVLMQMASSEPVHDSLSQQGKKFDFAELINQAMDLAGWSAPSLIVDMTPEDNQRAAMNNPALVKAQMDQHKLQQQHQNDLDLEAAKYDGRAGVQVVRHFLNESKTPEQPLPVRGAE